jgi:hypothetical protein
MGSTAKVPVKLKPGERAALEALAGGDEPTATRARIILACVGSATNASAARALGVSGAVVAKWKTIFLYKRVAGLLEVPPRVESPHALLQAWRTALADIAHDRALLASPSRRKKLRVLDPDDERATAALLEAANEASDVSRFAADVDEFGREAILPRVAEALLELVRVATRPRSVDPGAHTPVASPEPQPQPVTPEIPASRIRRVAPDPRLGEAEDEIQFAHLRKPGPED